MSFSPALVRNDGLLAYHRKPDFLIKPELISTVFHNFLPEIFSVFILLFTQPNNSTCSLKQNFKGMFASCDESWVFGTVHDAGFVTETNVYCIEMNIVLIFRFS